MSSAKWAESSAATLPLDDITAALTAHGWWAGEGILTDEFIDALAAELDRLEDEDRLRRAGIGRETDFQIDRDIRRDRIRWLNRESDVQAAFLDFAQAIKVELNRRLFLGLFEFEAHFALYAPGAFYRTHHDSFRGAANRVVSLVAFLNPDWQPEYAGELVLYEDNETTERARIAPRAGTLALFLSEEIPHEVRPTTAPRRSIAGWFRVNASIGGQIDPPR